MNRLVLAFSVVCLLQGLSAAPRPEYGLAVSITNSGKIAAVADEVGQFADYIYGMSTPVLIAGHGNYESTITVILHFIDDTYTNIVPILSGYSMLVADSDGDLDVAFEFLLESIDDAMDYLSGSTVEDYLTTLEDNDHTGVADQFSDAGERLLAGLVVLETEVLNVKSKLADALADNSGDPVVPAAILNANLGLGDMYAFLKAANNMKAYLPLLGYIMRTVLMHLEQGDEFITTLQNMIDNTPAATATAFTADLDNITDDIEDMIFYEIEYIYDSYDDLNTYLGSLDIGSATDFDSLQTTISSFVSEFDPAGTISSHDIMLANTFDEITSELSDLITSSAAGISAKDEALVQLLVDGLVGNFENGEYCYYKYKDLIKNLFVQGTEGGWACVDKEYIRLQHLLDTLLLVLELLTFDFEYMGSELAVCELVNEDPSNLDACVYELNTFYSDLLDMTIDKRDLLYTLADAEAVASKNRLLICFELNNIDVSLNQVGEIAEGLQICLENGPNGSD